MAVKVQNISARELLVLARKTAAKSLSAIGSSPAKRLNLCLGLLAPAPKTNLTTDLAQELSRLDLDQQHYWIGTFYTLLLPSTVRRAQAAYFTPPHLSRALLRLARDAGFDPLHHTAIDPAAGGAAFLSTLAAEMREIGAAPADIIRRLHGIEIDRGLARLSEALIAARVGKPIPKGRLVAVKDALAAKISRTYDLVIANPPYGRVSGADLLTDKWQQVCHPGHVNKYALFAELCFRLTKPGGLVALVLPSSFIAGPLYGRLRTFIREKAEVLILGSVTRRNDVFVDVAQDVSIILARAGATHRTERAVSFGNVSSFGPFKPSSAAVLPASPGNPWMLPGKQPGTAVGGGSLANYGAVLRAGYFVWNRELDRMSKRHRSKLYLPLIWACNVRPPRFCRPQAKTGKGVDFVRFNENSLAIVRTDALVMQRTTNSSQARRLVAARVSPSVIKRWGGFVSENHTIVITAPSVRALNTLRFLLNSAAVDARYRQLSGTASVSVNLLRGLDLPTPQALSDSFAHFGYTEEAIERAYATSSTRTSKVSA